MIGSIVLVTVLVTGVRSQYASYGPVDLEAVDPLSLSWNQVHWLVKNQIKEVEELKAEHDEIYNEIAGDTSSSDNIILLLLLWPEPVTLEIFSHDIINYLFQTV